MKYTVLSYDLLNDSYHIEEYLMITKYLSGRRTVYFDPCTTEEDRFKWTFFSVLCFFLLGNGYAFFEFNPIQDAVGYALNEQNTWQIMLGRFLIPLYLKCRGAVSSPLIIGSLTVLYMSIGVYLICRILDLNTKPEIVLTSAFLAANLSTFEISAVHQYYSDIFLAAFLFSCIGVFLLDGTITIKNVSASILCFFISFGLYPAFITVAACLFIVVICRRLIYGDMDSLIKDLFIWLGASIASGLMYIAGSRIALTMRHLNPAGGRRSIFSFGSLSAGELIQAVIDNYKNFYTVLFHAGDYIGRSAGFAASALLVICLFCFVFFIGRMRRFGKYLIIIVLALLFPIVSRLINVFTGNGAFRTMYAQYLVFPVLIRLCFYSLNYIRYKHTVPLKCIVMLLSAVIICKTIQFNNGGFILRKVMYERALYHTGRVIADIDEFTDGYGKKQKTAIVNVFDLDVHSDLVLEKQKTKRYRNVEGFTGDTGITYVNVFKDTADVLGYDLNWKTEYTDAVKNLPEVKNMPAYPEPGYIAEVGEYLVIKLSD